MFISMNKHKPVSLVIWWLSVHLYWTTIQFINFNLNDRALSNVVSETLGLQIWCFRYWAKRSDISLNKFLESGLKDNRVNCDSHIATFHTCTDVKMAFVSLIICLCLQPSLIILRQQKLWRCRPHHLANITIWLALMHLNMYFTYELIYVRFTPWVDDPEDDYDYQSNENSAVFYSSAYQYIILAIIFSKGKPYRQPIYSNSKYI
jgi:hypothetical protein